MKSLFTRRVLLNVEDASTKIPAEVLVGVRSVPQAATCQAPFCPRVLLSVPQDKSPVELESILSQEGRLSKVTAPEANRVPMSLEEPTTLKVEEGTAVLIPTWPSAPSAKNTGVARESVDEATLK